MALRLPSGCYAVFIGQHAPGFSVGRRHSDLGHAVRAVCQHNAEASRGEHFQPTLCSKRCVCMQVVSCRFSAVSAHAMYPEWLVECLHDRVTSAVVWRSTSVVQLTSLQQHSHQGVEEVSSADATFCDRLAATLECACSGTAAFAFRCPTPESDQSIGQHSGW